MSQPYIQTMKQIFTDRCHSLHEDAKEFAIAHPMDFHDEEGVLQYQREMQDHLKHVKDAIVYSKLLIKQLKLEQVKRASK